MRFEAIHVAGFGILINRTFLPSRGLNVFYGANEVGKSTLQQAFWALLYGFYRGDRKLPKEGELHEHFRPWRDDSYAGHLVYRLDGGNGFKVIRDFSDADRLSTSVWDVDTGRDVTRDFPHYRLGRVEFAIKHFGMSEEVFVNTCFVRQADLHRLAGAAGQIAETVMSLSATGSQNRSVRRALQSLEKTLEEQVGGPLARTKPLQKAKARLSESETEKIGVLGKRSVFESDYQERAQLLRRSEELTAEVTRLQYLLAARQKEHLADRIDRIEGVLSEIAKLQGELAELEDVRNFPTSTRDSVLQLHSDWAGWQKAVVAAKREVEASEAQAAAWRRDKETIVQDQRPLEPARKVPLESEPRIRDLEGQWRGRLSSANQKETALGEAQAQVDEMNAVRDRAQRRAHIIQAGSLGLHDLVVKWGAAESVSKSAAKELEEADRAWQEQPLSIDSYHEFEGRLAEFQFDSLSRLKEQEAKIKRFHEEAEAGLRPKVGWAMIIVGGIVSLTSLAAIVSSLISRIWSLPIGSVGVILGAGLVTAGALALRRKAGLNRKAKGISEQLTSDLSRYGIDAIGKLEQAFLEYLAAQAPYQRLVRTKRAAEEKRGALESVQDDARAVLQLPAEAEITGDTLETAENEAREITSQLQELEKREQRQGELSDELGQAKESLTHAEVELRTDLRAYGLGGGDLEQDLKRFYELCDSRRRLEILDEKLVSVEAKLGGFDAKVKKVKEGEIQRESARENFLHTLSLMGIDEPDPEEAFRLFEVKHARASAAQQRHSALDAKGRELELLQRTQTLDQLRVEHAALAQQAQELLNANQQFESLSTTDQPEALRTQLDRIRGEHAKANQELARLEGKINSAETGLHSLAEIEEEIQATRTEIFQLEFHRDALNLARQLLDAAADEHHRNFLPKLNRWVGQGLARVTQGRYADVQIDNKDFQIRIQVPNRAEPVTPEVLSRGAQEQIYLTLRLGLTELMSNTGERLPLMLDDPLVNYDHDRLTSCLELLREMAHRTQILLFTKDQEIVRWFRSLDPDQEAHRLHEL